VPGKINEASQGNAAEPWDFINHSDHDVVLFPLYCDYVYVLVQGKVSLEGYPKEVFSKAETLRNLHLRLPRIAHLMEILQKKTVLRIVLLLRPSPKLEK
jgi:hypothetical protein